MPLAVDVVAAEAELAPVDVLDATRTGLVHHVWPHVHRGQARPSKPYCLREKRCWTAPEVLAQIERRPRLHRVAADLFETWSIEADAAVLARVLHDWDDDRAVRILGNVRRALPVGGRVFLVEMLVSEDGTFGGLCDLHLLLATGGRERTADAYGRLLRAARFELVGVRRLAALPSVLEGVAR